MPYRAPTLTSPPPPPGRRVALGAVVVITAVGGALFTMRRTGAPATPVTSVTLPPRLPWPGQARAWTVHRATDGGRRIIFGPLRFAVSADRAVTAAGARFEATIVAAVPVATGWVFVTADGGVAWSGSFLDAPRNLGRFPCDFKVSRDSVGRAAVLGEDGSLWTTDGSGPLVHSRLPGGARAATFMDGTHGAAVLRDGRVLLTANGGQTWDRFVLANDVAWNVTPEEGGVAIETTAGRQVFRWEGAGSPGRPGASRPLRAQETAGDEAGLRAFIHGRYETVPPGGSIARCVQSGVSAEPGLVEAPRRYLCRAARPLRPLTLLPLPFQPGVEASDLLTGTESGPVRGRFWRTRPDSAGETLVRMSWMGVDGGGDFRGATHASGRGLGVHWPVAQRGPLRVEAASRRGALVSSWDRPDDPVLAWGTAARPFVRVRDPFVALALPGMRSFFSASPDGGVVVVFSTPLHESARETWSSGYAALGPQVGVGLALSPDGVVTARRGFVGDDPTLSMIARAGAVAGPVVRDHSEPPRWRMLTLDGSSPPPLPSIRWEDLAACGPARGDGPSLVVAYPPVALEGVDAEAEIDAVSRAELEVAGGALCVRAISLAGRRLVAAPGDRFVGAILCGPAASTR